MAKHYSKKAKSCNKSRNKRSKRRRSKRSKRRRSKRCKKRRSKRRNYRKKFALVLAVEQSKKKDPKIPGWDYEE